MSRKTYAEVTRKHIPLNSTGLVQSPWSSSISHIRVGILKVHSTLSPETEIQPSEFWFNIAEDPCTGELPLRRYRDLSKRGDALKRYAEMDLKDDSESNLDKALTANAKVIFKEQRSINFAIDDAPSSTPNGRSEEVCTAVASADTWDPFAARALDQIQARILAHNMDAEDALRVA